MFRYTVFQHGPVNIKKQITCEIYNNVSNNLTAYVDIKLKQNSKNSEM